MPALRSLLLLVLLVTSWEGPAHAQTAPEPVEVGDFRPGLAVAGAFGGVAAGGLAAWFLYELIGYDEAWPGYALAMATMPLGVGLGVHLAGHAPLGWTLLGAFAGSAAAFVPAALVLAIGATAHLDGVPALAFSLYAVGGIVAVGAPVLGGYLGGRLGSRGKARRADPVVAVGPLLQPAGLRVSLRI